MFCNRQRHAISPSMSYLTTFEAEGCIICGLCYKKIFDGKLRFSLARNLRFQLKLATLLQKLVNYDRKKFYNIGLYDSKTFIVEATDPTRRASIVESASRIF
jgi:hypothetical protein